MTVTKLRSSEQLHWGTRIVHPGVVDLVKLGEVIERLGAALES